MADDNQFLDQPIGETPNYNQNSYDDDELHTGLKILAVCIPLAGAIMYFTINSNYPNKKKQACNFALIGMGINLVLTIISNLGNH